MKSIICALILVAAATSAFAQGYPKYRPRYWQSYYYQPDYGTRSQGFPYYEPYETRTFTGYDSRGNWYYGTQFDDQYWGYDLHGNYYYGTSW